MDRTETYELIIQKADSLFRRFGMKTSVAAIAGELSMSPANIYKFFPSKRAIIEAVSERRMLVLRKQLLAVTKSRKPAFERIKDLMRCVVAYFEELIEKESDLLYLDLIKDMLQFELALREKKLVLYQGISRPFARATGPAHPGRRADRRNARPGPRGGLPGLAGLPVPGGRTASASGRSPTRAKRTPGTAASLPGPSPDLTARRPRWRKEASPAVFLTFPSFRNRTKVGSDDNDTRSFVAHRQEYHFFTK